MQWENSLLFICKSNLFYFKAAVKARVNSKDGALKVNGDE